MCRGVEPPDPGEGEEVVDQRLHPLGAVDREADVFGAAFVELVAVSLLQQLAERGDLAQRLLQIVGGDVGELLEFGVGPPQLLGLLGELRTGRAGGFEIVHDALPHVLDVGCDGTDVRVAHAA